ncbi:type II toxin-antitoxin system Phd/YefM family antitoxin [Sinomonas sp. RB5]
MATITVRELVRDSKRVFETLSAERTPIVVTRNGHPFAALMPIDKDQAETLLLASNPEIVEMQNAAEKVIADGGATSLDDALIRLEEESTTTQDEASDTLEVAEAGTSSEEVARDITKTADYITDATIKNVASVAASSQPDRQWIERIHQLNSELVRIIFFDELGRTGGFRAHKRIGRRKKNELREVSLKANRTALHNARRIVLEVNNEVVTSALKDQALGELGEAIETELRGGVAFAKRSALVRSSEIPLQVAAVSSTSDGPKPRESSPRRLLRRR